MIELHWTHSTTRPDTLEARHADVTATVTSRTLITGSDETGWETRTVWFANLDGGDVVVDWHEESPELVTLYVAMAWVEGALETIFMPDPEEWGGPETVSPDEYPGEE